MRHKLNILVNKGGPGSGHFGHAGRPGKVGGSSKQKYSEKDLILIDFMKQISKMSDKTTEHIVLKNGRVYIPQDLPEKYERGEVKMCFMNAFRLMSSNNDLTYVEGLAMPDFMDLPIHHAWVVDSLGNVIDNTWTKTGTAYFGIPFSTDFVFSVLADTKTYGMLGYHTRKYFENGFPNEAIVKEKQKRKLVKFKGGKGSGHFDHKGIPGHHGGSLPSGETSGIDLMDVDVEESQSTDSRSRVYMQLFSRQEVVNKFGKHEQAYQNKLTAEEKIAIINYTEQSWINDEIRSDSELSKEDKKQVDLMDSAINKGKMPMSASLTRYLVIEEKDLDKLKALEGKTIVDKAYLSTSLEYNTYKDIVSSYAEWAQDAYESKPIIIKMRIMAKKGAKACLVGDNSAGSTSEVILPRNAKLDISGVWKYSYKNDQIEGYDTYIVEAYYE